MLQFTQADSALSLQFTLSEGALSLPHPILVPYAKHSLKPLQKRVTLSKGFVQRESSLRSSEVTLMGYGRLRAPSDGVNCISSLTYHHYTILFPVTHLIVWARFNFSLSYFYLYFFHNASTAANKYTGYLTVTFNKLNYNLRR